jgi:hypothetical protein
MTNPASESWIDPIFDAVVSEIQSSGYFARVNQHEPKRKPGIARLTAAVWVQAIEPIGEISGLAISSGRLLFIIRLYANMLKEPQDQIDPDLLRACSNLMRRFHDDFDFGLPDIIRNVDVFGAHGEKLRALSGYVEQDKTQFRVMDIWLPLLIHDIWPQSK